MLQTDTSTQGFTVRDLAQRWRKSRAWVTARIRNGELAALNGPGSARSLLWSNLRGEEGSGHRHVAESHQEVMLVQPMKGR